MVTILWYLFFFSSSLSPFLFAKLLHCDFCPFLETQNDHSRPSTSTLQFSFFVRLSKKSHTCSLECENSSYVCQKKKNRQWLRCRAIVGTSCPQTIPKVGRKSLQICFIVLESTDMKFSWSSGQKKIYESLIRSDTLVMDTKCILTGNKNTGDLERKRWRRDVCGGVFRCVYVFIYPLNLGKSGSNWASQKWEQVKNLI